MIRLFLILLLCNTEIALASNWTDRIKQEEGVSRTLYQDSKGHWTIGVGHLVRGEERKKYEGITLTDQEIDELLESDIKIHWELAKQLTPNIESMSEELQYRILSATFRGSWGGSPKTRALVNQGEYIKAAIEFLNNNEYRKAKQSSNLTGIAKRMEALADILYKEASHREEMIYGR